MRLDLDLAASGAEYGDLTTALDLEGLAGGDPLLTDVDLPVLD
ncbi:MAG: hypothetical protein U0821_11860 [Chloroflexota bacterium]